MELKIDSDVIVLAARNAVGTPEKVLRELFPAAFTPAEPPAGSRLRNEVSKQEGVLLNRLVSRLVNDYYHFGPFVIQIGDYTSSYQSWAQAYEHGWRVF